MTGGRIRTLLQWEREINVWVVWYISSKVLVRIVLGRIRRGRWGTRFWSLRCRFWSLRCRFWSLHSRLWEQVFRTVEASEKRLPLLGAPVSIFGILVHCFEEEKEVICRTY